jgi:DNA-binding transcriptional LysR family regulator
MTLVQLRHFVCLAEHNSYVRASALLFVTQPALTRSIQALEEELGHPLFDRVGRRIELTAFGRHTLDHASRLVHDADVIKQLGQAAGAGQTGQLHIGLGSGPGAVLSEPLMLHMAQHHPKLQLNIARGNTERLIGALRERTIDGAIVDIRAMRPAADLEVSLPTEMHA